MQRFKTILEHKYFPPLFFLSLSLLFLAIFTVFFDGVMVWYGDSFEQQIQFYLGGWTKFHSGDFGFWEWSLGFGGNYLSYLFYFAASPFFFIYLLFPKESIIDLFLVFNAIKIFFLLYFSFMWLRKLSFDPLLSMIGALMITFSGWIFFFFHYNQFLDIFIYYPIILYLVEVWVQDKRYLLLSLSLGLLGIINFYFFYMFIPFIGLYVIYRLLSTQQIFWPNLFKFIGIGLLSIGISSVLLLPSFAIILNNERLSESIQLFQLIHPKDAFRFISTLFIPVMERFDPSYFISTEVFDGIGWSGGTSLYTSILALPLMGISLLHKDKTQALRLGFYALFIFFALFTSIYRLLQGSTDVRWFYMFIFIHTLLSLDGLRVLLLEPKTKQLFTYLSGALIMLITFFFVISYSKQWFGSSENLETLKFFVSLSILYLIIANLMIYRSKQIMLLLILILLETQFAFYQPIFKDRPIKKEDLQQYFKTQSNAIDYLNEMDAGYYRILNDTGILSTANEPFAYGYAGLSFYTSVFNYAQTDYLDRLRSTWSMPVSFGRPYTYLTNSVKYYITDDNKHLPPYGFDYLTQIGNEKIYLNRFYYPLGYATYKTFNEESFKTLSYLNQDRLFMDTIVTSSSTQQNPSYFNTLETVYAWTRPEAQYLDVKTDESFNLFVETFDIPVVTINLSNQSKLSHSSYTWQFNYTGLYVNPTLSTSTVEILPKNIYESNTQINIYKEPILNQYDAWFTHLNQQSFYNVEIGKDTLRANITIQDEYAWVATSIPFDKGWEVFVNGEKISYEKVNLGFIGFQLTPGSYLVEFKYFPPYLKEGTLITAGSLLVLFVFWIKKTQVH